MECSTDISGGDLESPLQRYLDQLKTRTYEELSRLPDSSQHQVETSTGSMRAVLWKDVLEDGRLRLVLQTLSSTSCCGGAAIAAVGFLSAPDGTCSDVPDDLMEEFQTDD